MTKSLKWYIYHSELKQNALIKWYIYHRKNQSKGGIYTFRILSTRLFNNWYIYHSELKQNALITWYIYHRKNQSKGGIYTRLACSVTGIYTILSLNRMRSQSGTYAIARNNPKVVYIPFKGGIYTIQRWCIYQFSYHQLVCSITGIYTTLRIRSYSGTYTTARINPKVVYIPLSDWV